MRVFVSVCVCYVYIIKVCMYKLYCCIDKCYTDNQPKKPAEPNENSTIGFLDDKQTVRLIIVINHWKLMWIPLLTLVMSLKVSFWERSDGTGISSIRLSQRNNRKRSRYTTVRYFIYRCRNGYMENMWWSWWQEAVDNWRYVFTVEGKYVKLAYVDRGVE